MKQTIAAFILFALLGCFLPSAAAEEAVTATPAGERLKSYEKHLQLQDQSIFKTLQWRNIGPFFMGGRIDDIEGYTGAPYRFLIATASGGLWSTTNNGTTWTPIFENESSITIGDIAVSQTDHNLIWVGSGEQNSSRSSYAGTGVFKSTDGGKTWKNMGLRDSHHIGRVLVHPGDNNTVFAASLGPLYTGKGQRGLYKTVDGGTNWKHVLPTGANTGIIDVTMDPKNNDIMYAASWERDRKAWNFTESGPGSSIYKSTDGGETWKKAVKGFPQGKFCGRIGLDVCPAKPGVVYAVLDNQDVRPEAKKKEKSKDANANLFNTDIIGAEIYRSNDFGDTWEKVNKGYIESMFFTYGYYFGQIRVAPDNPDIVYVLGVQLMKSVDGGKTFANVSRRRGAYKTSVVHSDMQTLWIDPKQPNRLLLGNDGGLNVSYDAAESWQHINNISLGQCYTIHYDNQKPYNIYTGLQDNGVNMGSSDFRYGSRGGIWKSILFGDGAFVQPDPKHPGEVYCAFQFGNLFRVNVNGSDYNRIQPKSPDKKNPYRFNWLSPFLLSPHNPYTLYMGANKVLRSVDRGKHWEEISPDLTHKKNTDGDVPFATITALDESASTPGLLYAGTDDGNSWVKKDSLSPWKNIGKGLPGKWVTRIVASKYKKERVYITMTGYREDDFKTYVYTSENYGETWTSIEANLPEEPLNVIREDPVFENILYLGSDLGIYISLDRGQSWFSLKNNLPTNAVYDLRVHPRDHELMIATHGRGVYLLSVEPVRKLTGEVLKKPLHVFDIASVPLASKPSYPQKAAAVEYYAGKTGEVRLQVRNKAGKVLKQMVLKAVKGYNRVEWGLQPDKKKGTAKKGADKAAKPGDGIKRVPKGEYKIILKQGKATAQTRLKVT